MRAWHMITVAAILALVPTSASAFCGFYVAPTDTPLVNEASMVALMRDGTRTVMSMSNDYRGPAADFAMVVPVPVVLKKEDVKTLDPGVFQRLEQLTAPRLVEYWEQDPCAQPKDLSKDAPPQKMGDVSLGAAGGTGGGYGVTVEAEFTVGEYEIVILGAKESDGLERWLVDNKYKVPKGIAPALAPYVKEQQKFFVARVDVKKVKMDATGVAVLSPLRFAFESADFRLPVRLGLLNAGPAQDLIVWILSENARYDVANYANVFIPTNLDVADATRASFRSFYAALFDDTLAKAGGKAIVTEYAWSTAGCDPCPVPPLDNKDLATLGADVLVGMVPVGTKSPLGSVNIGASKTTPTLPDADVMMARNRWRFRACYNKMLAADPTISGSVSFAVDIDAGGEVTSAKADKTTISSSLTSCVSGALRAMKWAGTGAKVTLTVPMTFVGPESGVADAGVKAETGPPPPMMLARTPSIVVTRLHARYDATTLGDDLVFQKADGVVGGREMAGHDGKLEHGATKTALNAFQARYVIRHAWTGPVACEKPRRGVWGGPPSGAAPGPAAATGLARAERKGVSLASFLAAVQKAAPASAAPNAPPPAPEAKKNCGCTTPGHRESGSAALALSLLALLARRRLSRSPPSA